MDNIAIVNLISLLKDNTTYRIYGHPEKWKFVRHQKYDYNCGIIAALNIQSIANKAIIENENEAVEAYTEQALKHELCEDDKSWEYDKDGNYISGDFSETGKISQRDGGTQPRQVKDILNLNGVNSHYQNNTSVDDIAEYIKEGKGVIIGIDALKLENNYKPSENNTIVKHFVSVFGILCDEQDNLIGFFICDTGKNATDFIDFYTKEQIATAMDIVTTDPDTGETYEKVSIITNNEIKSWADDIDATGNNENNKITGNNGDNVLSGLGGDDILSGGKGADTLIGGTGNDTYIFDNESEFENDIVVEHLNEGISDTLDFSKVTKSIDLDLRKNNANVFSNNNKNDVSGIENIIGTLNNDNINGNNLNNIILGHVNNDIIKGNYGDDILIGDSSEYIVRELEFLRDNPILVDESKFEGDNDGNDIIYGGLGNDLLIGGGGHDKLYGNYDNDYLYGGSGNDVLLGGTGTDYLFGGRGNDILCNYQEKAYMYGGLGNDRYEMISETCNEIEDDDNLGYVLHDYNWLQGAEKEFYKGGNTWVKNGYTYIWNEDLKVLLIYKAGDSGYTRINNYVNGALSIRLEKPFEEEQDDPRKADDIMTEPIVLDLNGDGVKTTEVYQGIYLDYNDDGFAERISWADYNDGVLVVDLDNNGKIDNGNEILTALTLESYDSNNDGIINAEDINCDKLKVLQVDGTLLSLEEAGVSSINTAVTDVDITDENGNKQFAKGSFTKTDGSVNSFAEYYFVTDYSDTKEVDKIEETQTISELPDIQCKGTLRSLHQAMIRDEDLQELVENFVSQTNDNERMNILDQIMYKWAGCSNIETNSRGNFINAQHLAYWEAVQGLAFVSQHEGEENPNNPNKEAADIIETQFQQIKIELYAKLMQQSHLKTYYDAINKTDLKYDLSPVIAMLEADIEQDPISGKNLVYQVTKMLIGLGIVDFSDYFNPKDDNCFYLKFTKNDRELKWLIDTISKVTYEDEIGDGRGSAADDSYKMDEQGHFHSLSGADVAYGSNEDDSFAMCSGDDLVDAGAGNDIIDTHGGNDIIFAGAGNDVIHASDGDDIIFGDDGDDLIYPDHGGDFDYAQDGNDTIRGGKGNDTIHSMVGDDTFIFYRGDGQDVVFEHQGVDTLYFGPDISWDDLIFEQDGDDMVISIQDTEDKITVKNWFVADEDGTYRYDNHKIEIFEFADGSKHYKDEITVGDNTESITYNMNQMDNDYVELASNYKTTVNLKQGNNHLLAGQNSDDTYVLNTEQTNVLIQDYDGNNTIKFGDGIQLAQTFFAFNENGLEVWFEFFDAHMEIQGDIDSFKFEFADATVVTDVSDRVLRDVSYVDYIMNDNQEELRLLGNDSVTVFDNDRDSNIITNSGDTTIDFGQNHTNVESRNGGNDTYIYNLGDCDKHISDLGGTDTIKFGEGITTENIHFLKNLETNELEIWFDLDYDNNDRITIENFFGDNNNKIENFEFADGSVINDVEAYIRAWGSKNDENLEIPENIPEAHLRGEGHITATGNDNDNWLGGNFGDNSFAGGKGNDNHWDDCKTNERYYYNVGNGHDNIDDIGGIDAIIFGQGITKENIRFTKEPENLIIWFDGIEDASICIHDYFVDDERKIELFKFSDGSVIDNIEPYIREVASRDNDIVLSDTQENAFLWDNADLNVTGNQYDNYIEGNEGNNTINAKGGNDSIQDFGGNDTYVYNLGDGEDLILDHGGNDKIQFGDGITSQNIKFEKINNHLNVKFEGNEGSILILNYFNDESDNKIEVFEFSDGSQITDISNLYVEVEPDENNDEEPQPNVPQNNGDNLQNGSIVMDGDQTTAVLTGNKDAYVLGNSNDNTVTGNSGNNTYALGGGNDTVIDTQGGNDVYHYNLNNGHDVITDIGGVDTIKFGRDIFVDNLRFEQVEHNLVISFRDEWRDGSLTITDYFLDDNHKIENFKFDDGTVITDVSELMTGNAVFENHTMSENTNIEVIRMAGEENLSVTGNSQNNLIVGNSGNNTFEGKGGDDYLMDHAGGNDTYIYNIGDGNDTIDDIGGIDTIKFGPDVTLENLAFEKTSTDLNIWFHNIENSGLCIRDYFSNEAKKIEKFELSDGTVITDISNYITAIASEDDVTLPNGVAQIHLWGNNNTTATGNDNDNWIGGNDGDNTIIGGKGNDYLYDDRNTNETYIYNLGDGFDCINDWGGYDVIKFGQNITAQNLVFMRNEGDLLIQFKDDDGEPIEGEIRIQDYFYDDNKRIEKLEFADGSSITNIDNRITALCGENDMQNHWSYAEVHLWGENNINVRGNYNDETFFGNNGNNTYDPQGGTDTIHAGTGNDTYIYNHDYQNKFIIDMGGEDVIKFGSGIDLENTRFVRNGNNLRLYFPNNGNGFIQIEDYFANNERKIERFEFADGTVITNITDDMINGQASYEDITLNGNEDTAYLLGDGNASVTGNDEENNFIYGNSGNNTYNGKGGHDHIEDRDGGDDTYIYNIGDGHDYIVDIGGNDTVKFGEGISVENVRFTHKNNDLQVFVDIGEEGGSVHIENYFKSDIRKIERFEFADGTVITDVSNLISGITIDSDYTFEENSQITEVYMKGREDLSVTGNNQDNHVEGNEGNNTYNLKGGNDSVHDYDGDDTYIYNLGDGDDFYEDENGFDTLKLGDGITQNMLRMERQDNGNLHIWFEGQEGSITICEHFWNDHKQLEKIILADNTEITDFTPFLNFVETEQDYTIAEGSFVRDVIAVGTNNVTLTGNNDDNHFVGNEGNTTFEGKGGNDSFYSDKGGNDTYVYNLGDGWDFITDIGGNDKIVLGEGITQDMIRMKRQWNGNLEIQFDGQEGNIVIQDYFNNNDKKIEKIVLADNTEITDFEQFLNYELAESDYTLPENSNKNDIVINNDGNISVQGNSQDNFIEGHLGNNTYQGNAGNDNIYDPDGNDTYIYNLGDGFDFINDDNGFDTLKLGEGITQDMIRMEQRENGNLDIFFEGHEGGITICEHFWNDNKRLDKIILADNTEITDFTPFMPQVEVDSDYTLPENGAKRDIIVQNGNDITINGNSKDNYIEINTSGNVTVQGNGGNDYVNEQSGGNTTYIYNIGDGWDTIRDMGGYDTVKFGAGLNVSDMKVMNRNGNGLEIWFDGVEGNLVIEDCLVNNSCKIEKFEFADGTIIENIEDYMNCIGSENDIELPNGYKEAHLWGEGNTSATGNDGDNHFNGNSGNNTFNGKKGNDSYWDDQGGDDTFIYNLGDGYDNIANIGGYDTIQLGAGITENMLRFERCGNGDLEIFIDADTEENSGSIRVQNYFNDANWAIEKLVLADNTEITDFYNRAGVIEVDSNYTMPNDSNLNYVIVRGENDVNITGNSQDNHIDGNEANNTYDLKSGDDFVYDPNGNDSYIYNLGDGNLTIHDEGGNDTIKLGAGITQDKIGYMKDDNNNVHIRISDNNGEIMILNQLSDVNCQIENIELADGTVITDINSKINQIGTEFNNIVLPEGYTEAHLWGEQNLNATGNNQDNNMSGNTGHNILNGKGGNDNIYDPNGDDTYIYNLGDGDDFYHDEGGYDTLQLGEGITQDMIRMQRRDDNALVITFEGQEGSITIWEHFAHDHKKLEKIVLSNGTEITDFSSYVGCDDEFVPDTPIDEDTPTLLNDDFDVNLLIQEMNSYGVDSDVVMTDTQNQNNEEILLAMVS